MDPAMRIVRAIKKKDRDQHQGGQSQQRKNNSRMLQPLVVNPHPDHHGDEAGDCPSQLPQQKKISGMISLLRHYGRGAEHHHQADKNQQQGHNEQQPVYADALRHGKSISSRRHVGTEDCFAADSA